MTARDTLASTDKQTSRYVTEAVCLAEYAEQGYEWVEGEAITAYVRTLLEDQP